MKANIIKATTDTRSGLGRLAGQSPATLSVNGG